MVPAPVLTGKSYDKSLHFVKFDSKLRHDFFLSLTSFKNGSKQLKISSKYSQEPNARGYTSGFVKKNQDAFDI